MKLKLPENIGTSPEGTQPNKENLCHRPNSNSSDRRKKSLIKTKNQSKKKLTHQFLIDIMDEFFAVVHPVPYPKIPSSVKFSNFGSESYLKPGGTMEGHPR